MGKAFDGAPGELAEKLFAALKAGDAAGGDSRGRQSASMLVVRKGGGRNINNDRYIYINVDDSADPFAELQRLLNLNLAYNYGDQMYKQLQAGKLDQAKAAGEKAVLYAPNSANGHLELGFLEYATGDKDGALAEFGKAKTLKPETFEKNWEEDAEDEHFKAMLGDQEFLKKLFPAGAPK